MYGGAIISDCGLYRYELHRTWDMFLPALIVGMLNPSTADAQRNDHTIRKLIGFAHRLDLGALFVWNAYAFRATKPADLWRAADPVGPENDKHIERLLSVTSEDRDNVFAVAWGSHAKPERVVELRQIMAAFAIEPKCWGITKRGQPKHPLMLGYDTPLLIWDTF